MANPKQGRNFEGVIYPDSESYDFNEVLQKLSDFPQYVYILHDKDTEEGGQLKKAHYHWLISCKSPVSLQTISNRLGVPQNAVEFCRSFKAFLLYMIHANEPDKYQYSVDDLQGEFKRSILTGDQERALVSACLDKIRSGEISSIQGLAAFAASTDDWPSFRRNYSILKDLLHEYISIQSTCQVCWKEDTDEEAQLSLDNTGFVSRQFDP